MMMIMMLMTMMTMMIKMINDHDVDGVDDDDDDDGVDDDIDLIPWLIHHHSHCLSRLAPMYVANISSAGFILILTQV